MIKNWPYSNEFHFLNKQEKNSESEIFLILEFFDSSASTNLYSLAIRRFGIMRNGEWPWPFTKSHLSKSANGQTQKLAIHFEIGHSFYLAIRLPGVNL